ncbi:hypothetical protein DFP72DRAFT_1039695 [Ephemerocybe angulata]|uniref:Uncharacterized protein n=1 Tax=Ephemerocybe angulata TaxID=980116 RepID=A0A8H6IFR2_9AGAR|nr:hypothetical protein DFP72DRAFT_1039695 [Tulosesus angulatus]
MRLARWCLRVAPFTNPFQVLRRKVFVSAGILDVSSTCDRSQKHRGTPITSHAVREHYLLIHSRCQIHIKFLASSATSTSTVELLSLTQIVFSLFTGSTRPPSPPFRTIDPALRRKQHYTTKAV